MAAIAPWFRLRLPSCDPRFKSQAHHLHFFQFVLKLYREKNENKQKEAGIGLFFPGQTVVAQFIKRLGVAFFMSKGRLML